jgi:hypothetical protein
MPPRTPEEEAGLQALLAKTPADFEAEATRRMGPPVVRARKNRRYVERLLRKHAEPDNRSFRIVEIGPIWIA